MCWARLLYVATWPRGMDRHAAYTRDWKGVTCADCGVGFDCGRIGLSTRPAFARFDIRAGSKILLFRPLMSDEEPGTQAQLAMTTHMSVTRRTIGRGRSRRIGEGGCRCRRGTGGPQRRG